MPKARISSRKRLPRAKARPAKPAPGGSDSFPVVAVGASAGGLEAVSQLLRALRPDTGMALVLVQHMDPTHESALATILARSTAMPVTEARENMALRPNRVYVIPPNKLMRISSGRLRLTPRSSSDPLQSIDLFFGALAEADGRRAIGVVLSGNGSDGTRGLLAIKAAGGITFAQEEQTAKYPAMPGSAITAGCVDFVLSPDRIAAELGRLAGHPYVAPGGVTEEADPLRQDRALHEMLLLLRQRTGVDFTHYKRATLDRRIQRRMLLHKLDSPNEYVEFLRKQPAEVKELYGDILIHVTGFFRDPPVFKALKKKVFPPMFKRREPEAPVRFWVPGCSTGEETYSLAISLLEYLTDRKINNPVQIFATDIHDVALDKARAGFYPETIAADVSAARLKRFFTRCDGGYRIIKSVREMCVFARHNLVTDPPFSNLDLVTCRNVLIYLDQSLQRKVLPFFHYALRPDAFLLLGVSESVGSFSDLFTLVDPNAKLYRRKATSHRRIASFDAARPERPGESAPENPPPPVLAPTAAEVQRQADRILLTHFSPAGVVVNGDLEVLQFRGHTATYLEHPHGEASLNLLKLAREGLSIELRTVVNRAIRADLRLRQEHIRFKHDGKELRLSVEVVPFKTPPAAERFFLVLFQPEEPEAKGARAGKRAGSARRPAVAADATELTRLREELAATRESLQSIIEEQEATNEELRSANEEITSSNEELQSTNEELETAKEELQSTNEELTTLNDELESRNGELENVNNDLHNLLVSANIPIIILGPDLRIRRFTGVAERTLNLIAGDVGRPITDLNLRVSIPDLRKQVLEVVETLTAREFEVKAEDGHWWSVRIRAYKTMDNKIEGAVIAMVDIDLLKNNVQLAEQGRAFAQAVLNTVPQPMLALDKDLEVQFLNPAFCRAFDLKREDGLKRRLYDLADGRFNLAALRKLLEEILPAKGQVADFELEQVIQGKGARRLRLSGQRLNYTDGHDYLTLLVFQEVAP